VIAGLAALAALGAPKGRKGIGSRFAAATVAGVCVGAYIALEFFPGQPPLQVTTPLQATMPVLQSWTLNMACRAAFEAICT
jgi:hypothetical protein